MKYRPEVDGLRALAVIPVILFHAGIPGFLGGYVGVDVFFVISGYLITSILLIEIPGGNFSLIKFYERRARRILPALYFVILCMLPLAYFLLLPSELKTFSQSLVAVIAFVSNLFFWRTNDYFAPAAELNPMLHTWSLSVEEQFYIFFPVLLLVLWRWGPRRAFGGVVVLSLLSFGLSELGWREFASANFYLLPTRAWELGVGVLCAFVLRNRSPQGNHFLAITGLGMLLLSIFGFTESTPFPSAYALLPVVGTALIILFATESTHVGRFLSLKPLVSVGLISYSAYLWHQPLLAFAKLRTAPEASMLLLGTLAALSIVLAAFSWRFVEQPFRHRGPSARFSRSAVFQFAGIGAIFIVGIGALGYLTDGLDFRLSSTERAILEESASYHAHVRTGANDRFGCFFDFSQQARVLVENDCVPQNSSGRIILFGDSEAAHYYDALRSSSLGENVFQWTGASCRPFEFSLTDRRCLEFLKLFEQNVVPTLTASDAVVVSANWINTYNSIRSSEFDGQLRKIIALLVSTGAKVLIVGNTPDFKVEPFGELVGSGLSRSQDVRLPVRDYFPSDGHLATIASDMGAGFVQPTELFCPPETPWHCDFRKNGHFLFFDQGHLSDVGAAIAIDPIIDFVSNPIPSGTAEGELGHYF